MLLSRSPETLFIFHTVEFIMSGLVVMVALWQFWKDPSRRRQWAGWIAAFLLLGSSFGLGAWNSYRILLVEEPSSWAPWLYSVCELLETSGLAVLVLAILGRWWAAAALVAVLGEVAVILAHGPSHDFPPSLAHSAATGALALFAFAGTLGRAREELRYGGLAFLLLAVAHLLSIAGELAGSVELTWSLATVLSLLGLTGLALAVERRSRDLFIQVFIRLNLTFIFLAGVLMLLASQSEHNKRMEFSRQELDELGEFLRGHLMYYLQQDRSQDDVLSSPVLFRRIVTDFGHHPDLRIVRLRIGERELVVTIDEQGMIDRQMGTAAAEPPPSPSSYRNPTIGVGRWPVFVDDRTVGEVVLEESRLSLSRDMAESVLVIFAASTSAVTLASLLIGAIVYQANERLRRQVQQIERSERQLMQAAKLASVGELVSGVAHEINNPLGVILSRTDYLREVIEDGAKPEEVSEDLNVIQRQSNRISRIVRDLLSFARPHSLELRPVALSAVLDRALELTSAHLRQSSVRLSREIPPDLPPLRIDPDRLQQVFINLINNAVDAMGGGGALRIRAKSENHHVLVTMADTGIGISQEELKRIFDPFFSTKEGGTGLGLSISYGILRDHGGRIWAESEPGKGTTFFLELPVEEVQRD